jgi:hypothetical protein
MTDKNAHPNAKPPGGGKDHEPKPGTHSDADLKKAKRLVRQMRRTIKSPCNRPPDRPNARFFAYAHEARTDLRFTGRLRWDDVNVDTSGYPITIDRWEAIIVACNAGGNPLDTDAETPTHNVTAATTAGTIATFTIADTHQYDPGDVVQVSGVTPAAYNGYWIVKTTPTSSKFTADIATSPTNGSAFGTAQKVSGMHIRRSLKMTPTFISVKTATAAASVATFTMRRSHHFEVGDKVIVLGMSPNGYNGIWRVASVPANDTWTANIGSSPINATDTGRAVEVEDQELEVQVPGELPRPRVWYWKGRVRCRSSDGCWSAWSQWTNPLLPWSGASNPKPPVPTYGGSPVNFTKLNSGRNEKVRLHFTYNEVGNFDIPGGDHQDDTDRYVVQIDRSDDGITWDGTPFRTHYYHARDGDADSTRTAIFEGIRRRFWYRCRVRTIDRFNRRGDWSAWTPAALPFDDTRPPTPLNVETWDVSTDRVAVAWDDPTVNTQVRGTASVTNGSATVTGSGSKWQAEVDEGSVIAFGGAPTTYYTVKRVASDTSMTLTSTYGEATNSSRNVYTVDDDPDVAFYEVQIARSAQVDTSTTPDTWNAIYAKTRTRGTRVSFRVQDSDKTSRFHARVRSIDAAANRSQWIPAWKRSAHGGNANNSPATDGDDQGIAVPLQGDGSPPASSPAANAAGYVGYIAVWWTPVANADPVSYDIHISTTTGFTPSSSTLVGSVPGGESVSIVRYNDGSALVAGTNYYVKVVARDYDGSASAGAQAGPVTIKAQVSDGVAPTGTSPTPFLTPSGDFIKANWTAMSNADPLSYEVHVSTTTGFTPSSTTLFAVLDGTSIVITRLPPMTSGGAALVPGTTYFVKIVARDFDGSATASAQASAVAPGQITDGLAPQASPAVGAVQGGVGFISVTWTPLTYGPRSATQNPDPVTYEVHMSTTTGFTPSGATKVGEVQGSGFFIRKTAAGAVLAYGTTYYIKVIAKDGDGSAAAGTQGSGTIIQANSSDLAVGSVTANHILAGAITADKLSANLAVAGKLIAAIDQLNWQDVNRVEIDGQSGLRLIGDDGTTETTLVHLPLDGNPAQFKGGIDADSLAVSGPATFKDPGNVMNPGSILTMGGGIANPNAMPSAAAMWPTFQVSTYDLGLHRGLTYAANGGVGGATPCFYGVYADASTNDWYVGEWRASDGVLLRSQVVGGGTLQGGEAVGACRSTNFIFVLYSNGTGANQLWLVDQWNPATLASSTLQDITGATNNVRPGIFWDGTNVCITTTATSGPTARPRISKRPEALSPATNFDLDATIQVDSSTTRVSGGVLATNLGQTYYYLCINDNGGNDTVARPKKVCVFNSTTGAEIANSRFGDGSDNAPFGITYNPSDGFFYSTPAGSVGEYKRHNDAFGLTSVANKVWFAYTWRDSDATNGVHETALSPRQSLAWPRRAFVTVTWPTPPTDAGGVDDVDTIRVYALQNATDPGAPAANYWRQATINSPATSTTLTSYATVNAGVAGAAFPNVTNAGRIVTPARFSIDGSEAFKFPRLNAQASRAGDQLLTTTGFALWVIATQDYEYLGGGLASGVLLDLVNNRFLVPTGWTGLWQLTVQVCWTAGADNNGRTEMMMRKNSAGAAGGGTLLRTSSQGGKDAKATQTTLWRGPLVAADYIEVWIQWVSTRHDLSGATNQPGHSYGLWEYVGN